MKMVKVILLSVLIVVVLSAQKMKTTQPTNYLREGPGSYFGIIAAIPASIEVDKLETKGSWWKVKTEQSDIGWLSENSFVNKSGTNVRDENLLKGKTSSRASRAELAAAVKGFGKKFVEGTSANGEDISKYSTPVVTAEEMDQFERSFSIEPFRGYMNIEKPFDLQFHEEAIGLSIAQKIASQKGLVLDRRATIYINLIGSYLSRYTKAYDLGFRFYIINDERATAFACPGGYVFISKGMFSACKNESEIAAVIAHEMVHVIQRHGVKELTKSKAKIQAEAAFAELEEETGPMGDEEKELEEYADNVYQNLISPRLLTYETDADKLSMIYLKRAGYDPTSLATVLQTIYEPSAVSRDIFDENYMKKDDMRDRILKVQQVVRSEGYRSNPAKQFQERYQYYISNLK